jgi:stearoyl-CoA desaturase (delta-9 desaturase)
VSDVLEVPVEGTAPRPATGELWVMGALLGLPVAGTGVAAVTAWSDGGVSALNVTMFVVLYLLTAFGIEVGYHRYCAHAAFRTGPVFEALMVGLGTMSFQGSAVWWAAIHRQHHQHSDDEGDPHSPHLNGPGLRGVLFGLYQAHFGFTLHALERRHGAMWKHRVPDLLERPVLRALGRSQVMLPLSLLGLLGPAVLGGALTGTLHGAWTGFLWGGLVRLCAVNNSTYAVNSLCHAFGSRPFALHTRDRSTNNAWLGPVTFGGSLHHNHHVFPASGVTATRWWQPDTGGLVLRALETLGVVQGLRRPPDTRDAAWTRQLFASLEGKTVAVTPEAGKT